MTKFVEKLAIFAQNLVILDTNLAIFNICFVLPASQYVRMGKCILKISKIDRIFSKILW